MSAEFPFVPEFHWGSCLRQLEWNGHMASWIVDGSNRLSSMGSWTNPKLRSNLSTIKSMGKWSLCTLSMASLMTSDLKLS